MGLSRTVSEINGDFGRKSPIFQTSVYVTSHWGSFRWNFATAISLKN